MSKLYIASKPVVELESQGLSQEHLYIIYDPDDVLDGNELVLRGGPQYDDPLDLGLIILEDGFSIQTSEDRYNNLPGSGSNPSERNVTLLAQDTAATEAWNKMLSWSLSVKGESPRDASGQIISDYDYDALLGEGRNSNSIANTALSIAGFNLSVLSPIEGGDFKWDVNPDNDFNGTRMSLSRFPGNQNLLSGAGSDVLQGFDGNDKIYDNGGGSDTFYGGDISNAVRTSITDGRDVVIYENASLGLGLKIESYADRRVVDDREGGTDTLYSIEQVNMRQFFLDNSADYKNYDQGINLRDTTPTELQSQKNLYGADVVSAVIIDEGSGNSVALNNFGTYVGTEFNDTFSLNNTLSRKFDGGDGVDTLRLTGSYGFKQGHGVHVVDSVDAVSDVTAASNMEVFEGTSYNDAYFVIHDMGHTYNLAATSAIFPNYSSVLSYTNYSHSLTFDTLNKTISDGTFTDQYTGYANFVGTNHGDTFILTDPFYSHPNSFKWPNIITGSGDDVIQIASTPFYIFYTGGNDQYSAHANGFIVLPVGVTASDISMTVSDPRIVRQTPGDAFYTRDITYTISGYGSILFRDGVGETSQTTNIGDINEETLYSNWYNSPLLQVWTETGVETVHYIHKFGSPTQGEYNKTVMSGALVNAYNGSLNAYYGGQIDDQFDFSIYHGAPNYYALSGDDHVIGDSQANTVFGGDGDDTVTGGGGNDTFYGGDGIDVAMYAGTYAAHTITINAGYLAVSNASGSDGTDALYDVEKIQFSDGVYENGVFTHTVVTQVNGTDVANTLNGTTGADLILALAGNDKVYGNAGNDTIYGGAGNDTLYGESGYDTLYGEAGNDIYFIDMGDVIVENSDEGTDTINVAFTYTLGANFENLTLTGTASINGTGNAFDNTITGNAGNNILDGGAGKDKLLGGAGNDTYLIDATLDVVTETANNGIDQVSSSRTYTLTANVENLTLTGTAAINGTGNALSNVLVGNTANNTLDGKAGADQMRGGAGNDTYVIDNTGDTVVENFNQGTDLVKASASYALSTNLENLTLTGTAALSGTGNTLVNTITGNGGANTLHGGNGDDTLNGAAGNDILYGDAGMDILTGGTGADRFVFENSTIFSGVDTVKDFNLTQGDTIDLTGVLEGYDPVTSAIADFVRITGTGATKYLEVDVDGGGFNYAFDPIATLMNFNTSASVETLVAQGDVIL